MKNLAGDGVVAGILLCARSFSEKTVLEACRSYPEAVLIAHPECREEVLSHAAFIGSTQALLDYTVSSPERSFIVATEPGILFEMQKRSPEKLHSGPQRSAESPQCLYADETEHS